MTTLLDLRRLRLRPGESRQEHVPVEMEPFHLGGQRYETAPAVVPVELHVSQASGAMVLDLRFAAALSGPCMRCLGHAEVPVEVSAREVHDLAARAGDRGGDQGPDEGRDELRSDYVADGRLDVGAWVRDAIALALPEQVLCRLECAGLCPVCGKDLNVAPHEHVEQTTDPRWAALQDLRDSF